MQGNCCGALMAIVRPLPDTSKTAVSTAAHGNDRWGEALGSARAFDADEHDDEIMCLTARACTATSGQAAWIGIARCARADVLDDKLRFAGMASGQEYQWADARDEAGFQIECGRGTIATNALGCVLVAIHPTAGDRKNVAALAVDLERAKRAFGARAGVDPARCAEAFLPVAVDPAVLPEIRTGAQRKTETPRPAPAIS